MIYYIYVDLDKLLMQEVKWILPTSKFPQQAPIQSLGILTFCNLHLHSWYAKEMESGLLSPDGSDDSSGKAFPPSANESSMSLM